VKSTENRYKKSAAHSGEAPHNQKQFNGTPPGSKNQWLAEFLLEHIGGRERPLKRPKNPSLDREFRGLISERNAAGEDIIINNGEGYYRAGPDDRPAVFEYWIKETHRAKEIKKKADTMMATYIAIYGGVENECI
jgi:hypothetical protein